MIIELVTWEMAGSNPGFISYEKVMNYHNENHQDIENTILVSE